jgi:hypothetical protein
MHQTEDMNLKSRITAMYCVNRVVTGKSIKLNVLYLLFSELSDYAGDFCFQISQFSEYGNFNRQSFQILKIFHFISQYQRWKPIKRCSSPVSKLYENASCQLVTKNAIDGILETLLLRLAHGRLFGIQLGI